MTSIGRLKPETVELFREYSEFHRDVFLEEVETFIHGAGSTREELDAIRKVSFERGKYLRSPKSQKRGRPRGARTQPREPKLQFTQFEPAHGSWGGSDDVEIAFERDWKNHGAFRTVCMVLGDFPANRPSFLGQILLFIRSADRRELAKIRHAVAERAKSRGIGGLLKERGRPRFEDDERLLREARVATWMHYIDHRSARQIAEKLGMKIRKRTKANDGNIRIVRQTLRRKREYLAATVWKAAPDSWVVRGGKFSERRELKQGILDSIPARQWFRSKTGLPFHEYPKQCQEIVLKLWPRGLNAATKIDRQEIRHILQKNPR